MAAILLIHGGWHAAWCWFKVVPRLERLGHKVVAIDLPGHGRNQIGRPPTMADYETAVVDALGAFPEPAIVIAHSMGGIVLQRACELVPELVREGVYLTAGLVRNGQGLAEEIVHDTGTQARQFFEVSEDRAWVTIAPGGERQAFYHDCSDDDVSLARLCLTPQALTPTNTPIQVSEARFGTVPRTYIECLDDVGTSLAQQRRYQSAYPPSRVFQLQASHSPFLSRPDELTELIHRIASS